MSDHKPIALHLPLHGSHLIEASAGTGKTFTIALLYVRLVLGPPDQGEAEPELSDALRQGVLPQNLLVVTFTEAATKELRERIRRRLTEAAEVFAGVVAENSDNAMLFALRQMYSAQNHSRLRAKLLLAAEWMDEASISTIHSWCYQMLQEHAFDSGNLFSQTLVTSIKELQLAAVRDYWRSEVYPLSSGHAERFLALYAEPRKLVFKLKGLFAGAIDSRTIRLSDIFQQFDARLAEQVTKLKAQPWQQWSTEMPALLEQLKRDHGLDGRKKTAMVKVWAQMPEWAESNELLPAKFGGAGFENQRSDALQALLTSQTELTEHPGFKAIDDLWVLEQLPNSISKYLLQHASDWVGRRVSEQMSRRAELSFNDLLENLHSALQGERGLHLAAQIREQFPAAMIDEFQDTDHIQYEIFDRIYRVANNHPSRCFVMIGDPKQAIYAFRGADIFTYLEARRSVGERIHTLGTNFRSDKAVVAAVNTLFEHADRSADGAFLFGSKSASELPFEGTQAKGTAKQFRIGSAAPSALTFWSMDASERAKTTGKIKPFPKEKSFEHLSAVCATQIVELLNHPEAGFYEDAGEGEETFKRLSPGDIAILVNNKTEAAHVRQALSTRGVRSVYLSDSSSVLHSAQAHELLHWLRAFAEPRRLDLIRTALATPALALSHDRLEAFNADELVLGEILEQFEGYQTHWQRNGLFATLRLFLNDYAVPARLLAAGDERGLTDILHLGEILQAASMQLDGEHALIRQYEQMLLSAEEEQDHLNMRLESDANLVQVVTVHKSKGLEYPLVFLPFGTSLRSMMDEKDFVRYHNKMRVWENHFNPTDEQRQAADHERLAEDLRKLYVALTRAKYGMWVGAPATKFWTQSALGYALGAKDQDSGEISRYLHSLAEADHIEVISEPEACDTSYTPVGQLELGEPLRANIELQQNWWIASYSRIQYEAKTLSDIDDASTEKRVEEADEESSKADVEVQLTGYHAFIKGAGPGDFLHNILEWCCNQGFNEVMQQPQRLKEEIEKRCEAKNSADYNPALITQWIEALLSTPFQLPNKSQTSLMSLAKAKAEMEFWFEAKDLDVQRLDQLVNELAPSRLARPAAKELHFNGMLKGFIDLSFEHEGRYYVLDYKSTFLGNDDSAYTLTAMEAKTVEKRYDLQYIIYTLALHRYLGSRLPDYDYEIHIGGAMVMFLRGVNGENAGIYCDRPPKELIEQMDRLFSGVEL